MDSGDRARFTPAVLALAAIASVLLPEPLLAEETFILNGHAPDPYTKQDGSGQLDRIVQEAFSRAGLAVQTRMLPGKRGIAYADRGLHDGHYVRGKIMLEAYPNLVPVPVVVARAVHRAVSKAPGLAVDGWESLGAYVVGYYLGSGLYESHRQDYGEAVPVRSFRIPLRMVQAGHIDLALIEQSVFRSLSASEDFSDLVLLSPPIEEQELFIMLNRRHEALLPKLTEALESMREDGTIVRLCPACR